MVEVPGVEPGCFVKNDQLSTCVDIMWYSFFISNVIPEEEFCLRSLRPQVEKPWGSIPNVIME